MKILLLVLVALGIAGLAWIRLAPSDSARWNVDPLDPLAAPVLQEGGWKVAPEDGNARAPVFEADPEEVLRALDGIAMATPRTTRLAGSVAEGRITYVTRSALFGFPDYTTVAAVPAKGGTAPVIYARLRFGRGDMGVNRARVETWLRALGERLG